MLRTRRLWNAVLPKATEAIPWNKQMHWPRAALHAMLSLPAKQYTGSNAGNGWLQLDQSMRAFHPWCSRLYTAGSETNTQEGRTSDATGDAVATEERSDAPLVSTGMLEQLEEDDALEEALEWHGEGRDPLEDAFDPNIPGLPPLEEILSQPDAARGKGKKNMDKEYTPPPEMVFKPAPELDNLGRAYATGKRKSSVARVWLWSGTTERLSVNGRYLDAHFPLIERRYQVLHPLVVTDTLGSVELMCTVKGGGTKGQAGAISHGISKALERFDPPLREPLKRNGLLTRDARKVERKKPGKSKARRSPQFSKR